MSKTIPLTHGLVTIVDDEDYEELSQFKWFAHRDKATGSWYARRSFTVAPRRRGTVLMHRQITGAERGRLVDHKNRDTLDNRRENIRVCTGSGNQQNKVKREGTKYRFKGVRPCGRRWEAKITVFYERIWLGLHDTEELAALAYDAAARKYHGEFARPNFDTPASGGGGSDG